MGMPSNHPLGSKTVPGVSWHASAGRSIWRSDASKQRAKHVASTWPYTDGFAPTQISLRYFEMHMFQPFDFTMFFCCFSSSTATAQKTSHGSKQLPQSEPACSLFDHPGRCCPKDVVGPRPRSRGEMGAVWLEHFHCRESGDATRWQRTVERCCLAALKGVWCPFPRQSM